MVGKPYLTGLWKGWPSSAKWRVLWPFSRLGESLPYRNVHGNTTLWPQLHNFVGGSDLGWKPIGRAYYLKGQFAGALWAELEIVCFPNGDRNSSGAYFLVSRWKVSAVFGYRSPIRGDCRDLQTHIHGRILRHDI